MCEKCRMMELFDVELARFGSYDHGEAFSIARHRYALEKHGVNKEIAMVIAHREPLQEPSPPSREKKAVTTIRELENTYIEQGSILEWIQMILDGKEVSEFALSFLIVQQVWDLKQEESHE